MKAYTDPDLTGLRVKTPDEVRTILAELRRRMENIYDERLRGLYLFGSYARGEAVAGSDLDVLVVLDRIDGYMGEVRRTGAATGALSLEYDTSIIPVFVREESWREEDSLFLTNVRREGCEV